MHWCDYGYSSPTIDTTYVQPLMTVLGDAVCCVGRTAHERDRCEFVVHNVASLKYLLEIRKAA